MSTPKEMRSASEWLEIAPMSRRQIELIQADVLEWCVSQSDGPISKTEWLYKMSLKHRELSEPSKPDSV